MNLIKLSAKKWTDIAVNGGVDNGVEDCPLCQEYWDKPRCGTCPIKEGSGKHGCNETLYLEWKDHQFDIHGLNSLPLKSECPECSRIAMAFADWILELDEPEVNDCKTCVYSEFHNGATTQCYNVIGGCSKYDKWAPMPEKPKWEFPCYGVGHDNTVIVHFTADGVGDVVRTADGTGFYVGEHWKGFFMDCYEPCEKPGPEYPCLMRYNSDHKDYVGLVVYFNIPKNGVVITSCVEHKAGTRCSDWVMSLFTPCDPPEGIHVFEGKVYRKIAEMGCGVIAVGNKIYEPIGG